MQKTLSIITCKICLLILPIISFGKVLNVQEYGARGDGRTDNTRMVQQALDACRQRKIDTLFFPRGTYLFRTYIQHYHYFENYFLRIHSQLTILGQDSTTRLMIAANIFDRADSLANAHLLYGQQIRNFSLERITIDMNGGRNIVPRGFIKNHSALFIDHGEDVTVRKVQIVNCAGRNMIIIKGKGNQALIENSRFLNGGRYVGTPQANEWQDDFSFIYCEWDHAQVINNIIRQENPALALTGYTGGIELHGSYSEAAGNEITGCYPGIYVSSSWYPVYGTLIENNRMTQCVKGVSFWIHYPMNDVVIRRNLISLTKAAEGMNPPVISGIDVPNGNSLVYGFDQANNAPISRLQILQNDIRTEAGAGSVKTAGVLLHSLQQCRISNNTISGMSYAGLVFQGTKWGTDSLLISNNRFDAFTENPDRAAVGGYVVITDSYAQQVPGAPGIRRVYLYNNQIPNSPSALSRNNFFGVFAALPKRFLKEIRTDNSMGNPAAIRIVSTD